MATTTHSLDVTSPSTQHILPPDQYYDVEEGKPENPQESAMNMTISPSIFQKIFAELVGTFILVFVGCGSVLVDREKARTSVGIAMVWGLVVMIIVYTLGHISGSHVNPALTIAFAATRRFPLAQVPMYVLAQVLGATLACLILKELFHHQGDISPIVTQYSTSTTLLQALTWEFIVALILTFVVCGVTDHRASKELAGAAIGATVFFNGLIAGEYNLLRLPEPEKSTENTKS